MRFLVVGDMHVRPEDLGECRALSQLVASEAVKSKADYIVLLGDQYHSHSIVHVDVLQFWKDTFEQWKHVAPTIAVVGNHDQPADEGSRAHSFLAHEDQVTVIKEFQVYKEILFVGFQRNHQDFLNIVQKHPTHAVYCHQTFAGSQFENGFYAKDGLNPDHLPQVEIVSGHIHAAQQFGKVWYPGSPRWMGVSDANEDKSIWVVEHDAMGRIVSKQPIPTDTVCTKIVSLEVTPITPPLELKPNVRYVVDVKGPPDFIEVQKKIFEGRARVRTFCTEKPLPKVRESDGIKKAFWSYQKAFEPKFSTKERVEALCKERLGFL